MKALLVSIGVLSIAACATPLRTPKAELNEFTHPHIGEVATVSVGDRMIAQGVSIQYEAVQVGAPLIVKGQLKITQGEYKVIAESDEHLFAAPYEGGATVAKSGDVVSLSSGSDRYRTLRIEKATSRTCVVSSVGTVMANWCADTPATYTRTIGQAFTESGFQQTLVYSGRTGDYISLSYREFSGGHARSAFENQAKYDLGSSDLISYKGAKIQVIEATNQSITYKLLSSFRQR